jgi:hypothetical protein
MIYPTDARLLAGIADTLRDVVLPELERGSAARKQLQAALEILRRMAFALPEAAEVVAADNEDMAAVLKQVQAVMEDASPPPNLPHQGGGTRSEALPIDGGGLGGVDDAAARNLELQARLTDLQNSLANLPSNCRTEIETLLAALYTRMTDRALALIPPPAPHAPKGGA